jgi:hypothetical protein
MLTPFCPNRRVRSSASNFPYACNSEFMPGTRPAVRLFPDSSLALVDDRLRPPLDQKCLHEYVAGDPQGSCLRSAGAARLDAHGQLARKLSFNHPKLVRAFASSAMESCFGFLNRRISQFSSRRVPNRPAGSYRHPPAMSHILEFFLVSQLEVRQSTNPGHSAPQVQLLACPRQEGVTGSANGISAGQRRPTRKIQAK